MILDTGSADLWVADTNCSSCPSSTQEFDPSKSSTFKGSTSGTTINYGSGQVSGELAQDAVSMGGFNISNQGLCMFFFLP
jgi:cathepsin D